MKKLFVASALALALTMASQQKASAWSEFKFGIGLNFGWCGGGNRILWGAYHSAPYPGGQDLGPWLPGLFPGYPPVVKVVPVAPVVPVVPVIPGAPVAPLTPLAPVAPGGLGGSGLLDDHHTSTGYQPVGYSAPASYF